MEKLLVAVLIDKFPVIYGSQMFITVLKIVNH